MDGGGLCTCCLERLVWAKAKAHGYNYCDQCAETLSCDRCEHSLDETFYIWQEALCSDCQKADERERVRVAVEHGLADAGFELTGASNRSEANYWSLPGYSRRVRIAEHDPSDLYPDSGECFCIGLRRDLGFCAVTLDHDAEESEIREAVVRAVAAVRASGREDQD